MRLAILTGGGDCSGLNAVIRAITKPAISQFGMEVFGFLDGFSGLVEGSFIPLSDLSVSGILSRGGTILGTSNKADPFHYPAEPAKAGVFKDVSDRVIRNIRKMRLNGLIVIGGDGTLNIAYRLSKLGVSLVAVPKTIDNDLAATDLTFGFDSAVAVVTDAVDRLHTTAESHHRIMVVEVMGRYAGWIALFGGVAGGGDVILIPEIPFDLNKVSEKIISRAKHGKKFSIVVVAEGAHAQGGHHVIRKRIEDSPDPVRLGGVGAWLSDELEKRTGKEARATVLGHLQRGGSPTSFDRILATRFGHEALRLFQSQRFGRMVAWQSGDIASVPIARAVRSLKTVPLNHPLIRIARSLGTSFGDPKRD